jgi:hypothetical protein
MEKTALDNLLSPCQMKEEFQGDEAGAHNYNYTYFPKERTPGLGQGEGNVSSSTNENEVQTTNSVPLENTTEEGSAPDLRTRRTRHGPGFLTLIGYL